MGTCINIVDKSRGIPKEKQEEFKKKSKKNLKKD